MARARNLKPGFFINEILSECPFEVRLLFQGLWILADREGRLEDRPKKIKAEIFPYDDLDVDAMLADLEARRDPDGKRAFIVRYEANGMRYIQVLNFAEHQNPHQNEKPSRIPGFQGSTMIDAPGCTSTVLVPELHQSSTVQEQEQHKSDRAESLFSSPDSGIPHPSTALSDGLAVDNFSGGTTEEEITQPDSSPDFLGFWRAYPRRHGSEKAIASWEKAVKAGISPLDMIAAAAKYARQVKADETPVQFMKMPHTWIGEFVAGWRPPPDCNQCPDRLGCKNGVIMWEEYDEFAKTTYSKTTPCPHGAKAAG